MGNSLKPGFKKYLRIPDIVTAVQYTGVNREDLDGMHAWLDVVEQSDNRSGYPDKDERCDNCGNEWHFHAIYLPPEKSEGLEPYTVCPGCYLLYGENEQDTPIMIDMEQFEFMYADPSTAITAPMNDTIEEIIRMTGVEDEAIKIGMQSLIRRFGKLAVMDYREHLDKIGGLQGPAATDEGGGE